jgi:peptidoglycan-associated lipoprotein
VLNCQGKRPNDSSSGSSSGLNTVYFDYDQAFIRGDAANTLQSNAAFLKNNGNVSVVVEGHCDERGTNEYNLALGQRRAQSGADYIANLGVNASRMRTVSFGEEKPVCYESNESCWQRNRRADFRR